MKSMKEILTPLSFLVLAGVVMFDHVRVAPHHVPTPPPPGLAANGQALGEAYAPLLLSTYGDAWLAAASTLEQGKSVADAQKALQDTWKDARVKAFTDHVAPPFALVLPEGTEPSTPQKRAQVVQLWRGFAQGLKGVR